MRTKIPWSDETKNEMLGQSVKHHVWQTPGIADHLANTIPMVNIQYSVFGF